ncbi:FAD-binding oxidoreductase [Steroidobacter sp.]|uniref:FAD-binding oxidoreductase n=1 Tax=Steroidobacter sp. TaxID=1978227 RepID=UPI002EDA9352
MTLAADVAVLDELEQVVGAARLLTSKADREYFAMDVYGAGETPIAVALPETVAEVQSIVRVAARRKIAIVTRGGAASYTASHLPSTRNSLIIDTSRLNRILEINERDMYVTVEAGVTWNALREALSKKKLRTPFWGPFSGFASTVGGGASQNAASLGSGAYGISADSILGFEVVLANGEVLRTGSHAIENGKPFYRWYGPDLTGLFCGDSGALGIKVTITLRLIPEPEVFGAASFGFETFEAMAAGLAAVARSNVASDNFGLDPKLQQGQMGEVTVKDAIASAIRVARASRNPLEAAARLASMAAAGKRFLSGWAYSTHFTVEGVSKAEIRSKLAVVRRAVKGYGRETANTIPTVIRAAPFVPLNVMIGPRGERWAPQHGVMPFSAVSEFHSRITRLYAANAERMKRERVTNGAMFMTLGTHAFLYEPVFYWEDELTAYHRRYLSAEFIGQLPKYPENLNGRRLVAELREQIREIFSAVGSIHFQIGKCYPYMKGRQGEAAQALRAIKQQLDPNNLMNPGALGL